MKRFSFLQVVVLAALLVAIASCGTPMYSEGDPYEQGPPPASVYYADPYFGGVNTVIVERNPYTGQYYQVVPGYYGGGGVYAAPAYPYYGRRSYGYGGGSRYYNNRTYSNRNYNNSNAGNNNSYYKTYPQRQQPQAQQAPLQQRPQFQQQRQEAKSAILGKRRF